MIRLACLLLLLFPYLNLTGCVVAAVGAAGTTATAAHDRRGFGSVFDDQTIEVAVGDRIYSYKENDLKVFGSGDRIKIVSHNAIVLLIGTVDRPEKIQLAGDLAAEGEKVRKVVNELTVGEKIGIGPRIGDNFMTSKVKNALFDVDIDGFDPTRVNVTTVDDTVYLMGLVTEEEGAAAALEASKVSGVVRVVKVFEYIEKDRPAGEAQAESEVASQS